MCAVRFVQFARPHAHAWRLGFGLEIEDGPLCCFPMIDRSGEHQWWRSCFARRLVRWLKSSSLKYCGDNGMRVEFGWVSSLPCYFKWYEVRITNPRIADAASLRKRLSGREDVVWESAAGAGATRGFCPVLCGSRPAGWGWAEARSGARGSFGAGGEVDRRLTLRKRYDRPLTERLGFCITAWSSAIRLFKNASAG